MHFLSKQDDKEDIRIILSLSVGFFFSDKIITKSLVYVGSSASHKRNDCVVLRYMHKVCK